MFKRLSFPLALMAYGVVLAMAAALAVGPSLTWAEDDDDEGEEGTVHHLMEKTHEGRRSPWRKVVRAVRADRIDWATVDSALPRFEKMSAALTKAKNSDVRDSADGYVDAVKELTAKTKARDAAGARSAVKSLSESCADCHYKGGPGGKFDD